MTVTAELDQLRVLLRTVDPAALTNADYQAMLLMLKSSIEARGIK